MDGEARLSAEWLTAALQGSGAGNASIASFKYGRIAAGVGFLGQLGRLRLKYPTPVKACRERLTASCRRLTRSSRQHCLQVGRSSDASGGVMAAVAPRYGASWSAKSRNKRKPGRAGGRCDVGVYFSY